GGRPGGPGGYSHGGESREPFAAPSDAELRAIVADGDAETLVRVAERVGKALVENRLTTSQIRSVFGAVREIEMSWPRAAQPTAQEQGQAGRCQRELLLLKPKLAYQAVRAQGRGMANLKQVLDPAIGLVGDDRERFQHFVDLFEAILAYHRAYGGQ